MRELIFDNFGSNIHPVLLKANGIKKSYISNRQVEVLRGVDLEVKQGEIVAIEGKSGAGKSTLLNILGTLEHPDAGEVMLNGVSIFSLSKKKLYALRNRHIGFVFQFHHLLPEFTALENACMPALIAGDKRNLAEKKALDLLDLLGLADRKDHKPAELSGGENQRVAVARALINKPEIVFADEPSGNLDAGNGWELNKLMMNLRNELGQTFVIVTHNPELSRIADRVLHMQDGRIIQQYIQEETI